MMFPQYDELVVISDIHMGGLQGFQILGETNRLSSFILHISEQHPDDPVALVFNGDTIDTLAEETGGYVAFENAEDVVRRIMGDPSFSPVWDALSTFVSKENHTLVFVIGNHDIELSYPGVQRLIVERLTGNKGKSCGIIEFSCMGAGFSCRVGGSRVFCTHGNEVDDWNYIRYEDLAKAARRINAGKSFKPFEWKPNAGTKMVKDIMNGVKQQHPWIDLLKPEMKGAVGVLAAIDPAQLKKIKELLPVLEEKFKGAVEYESRLSADEPVPPRGKLPERHAIGSLLGPCMLDGMTLGTGIESFSVDQMLRIAEEQYSEGSALSDTHEETLGAPQYIWERLTSWLTGITRAESLRRALVDWLDGDKTFRVDDPDDTFKETVKTVGPDIHFIVTGHTHLERAIDLGNNRYYFNCGTWIRLLKFTDDMLKNEQSFTPIYNLLLHCSLKDIDTSDLLLGNYSAVRIRAENGKTVGRLVHITPDGKDSPDPVKEFKR